MARKYQRNIDYKKQHVYKRNHIRRIIALGILPTLLIQWISVIPIMVFGMEFSPIISAQASVILPDKESVELFDGANGEIAASIEMPDLIFVPEEDGAWMLEMDANDWEEFDISYWAILYEKQENNRWEKIDSFSVPGGRTLDVDGSMSSETKICQFYQKGHTYKICFDLINYECNNSISFRYSFHKTGLAGCNDGLIWRIHYLFACSADDRYIMCQGYIGNETTLCPPDQIGPYPVKRIYLDGYSTSKQCIETIIARESIDGISGLSQCKNLKDIYIYNRNYTPIDYWLPIKYDVETGQYYSDTVTHSYAGSAIEKLCRENNWPFVALPELPSPIPTNTPTVPTATILPSPSPLPTEAVDTPSPTPAKQPEFSSSAPTPTLLPTSPPLPTEVADTPSPTPAKQPEFSPSAPTPTLLPTSTPLPTKAAGSPSPMPTKQPEFPSSAPTHTSLPTQTFFPSAIPLPTPLPVNLYHPLPTLSGLKISTDHYTKIKLTWRAVPGAWYQIYRSTSRGSVYKRIKGRITKTHYLDISVKSGKTYYYQVKAVKIVGGKPTIQAESQTKQIKIRTLTRPTIQIQKKRTADIRYLVIKVKKYKGKHLEIYYKDSKRSSYRKVKLYEDRIQKMKKTFRIQYLSTKRNLYLKVRTYQKKNGKKVYSSYTREKKIKV